MHVSVVVFSRLCRGVYILTPFLVKIGIQSFFHRGQQTDDNPTLVGRRVNHSVQSGVPPKLHFGGQEATRT